MSFFRSAMRIMIMSLQRPDASAAGALAHGLVWVREADESSCAGLGAAFISSTSDFRLRGLLLVLYCVESLKLVVISDCSGRHCHRGTTPGRNFF